MELLPRFLLLLPPFASVELNHPLFWILPCRLELILEFPSFGRDRRIFVSCFGESLPGQFLSLGVSVGPLEPFVITRSLSGRSGRRLRVFVSSTVAAPSSPELLEPSLFLRVPQVAPP